MFTRIRRRRTWFSACLLATFAYLGSPRLEAAELLVTADAYVNSGFPSTNFGSLPYLHAGGASRTFVRFDTVGLPDLGANGPARANLILWVSRIGTAGAVSVYDVPSGWDEGSITSANAPSPSGTPLATVPVNGASSLYRSM